jgi:CheY-like chemotaxis protein
MRILWIDDEIDLLRPYVYSLKEKGYEVDTATNGPDGIELVRTKDFDLVLLDEIMSGMDGLTVLKKLKEIDPNILVAMVTKSEEEALMNEAYAKLVDDFVVKPFTPIQITAVLKRLLEKKKIISDRIAQEYATTIAQTQTFDFNHKDWLNYYVSSIRWANLLQRFGDEAIKESYEQHRLDSNLVFSRYITDVYRNWLQGKNGPILSNKFFEQFIIPRLGRKPHYLFIFDSMRLDQWYILAPILREFFEIDTQYFFSILPSATPYSRNAMFSGLLPLEILKKYPQLWVFDDTGQNRYETELLQHLLDNHNFRGKSVFLKTAHNNDIVANASAFLSPENQLSVMVVNFLDLLIHSAKTNQLLDEITTNEYSLVGLTRLWFTNSEIFRIIKELRRRDCEITISSDHGFIKVGHPLVIYGGREISANLRYKYGGALRTDERHAILLSNPETFMLPSEHLGTKFAIAKSDYYFIYPTKPKEYEKTYKYSYQHGGVSLEEMILPVGMLKPKKS